MALNLQAISVQRMTEALQMQSALPMKLHRVSRKTTMLTRISLFPAAAHLLKETMMEFNVYTFPKTSTDAGVTTSVIKILFDENVKSNAGVLENDLFVVKKGGTSTRFNVQSVSVDGAMVTVTVTGDEAVIKGDTIDIAIVYDAIGQNYTSNLKLQVQYPTP
jgi:hypothetical protein